MIEKNLEKTHEEIVDEQDNKVKEPPEAIKQPENTRKPVLELIENCKPASAEATPAVASELYTCKQCRKQFDKRPVCIMHIITEHMQERFPGVPHLIDEKYLCHHAGCTYNSVKRNGLLAHLTLKHNAINIMDVTELMLHSDEDEAQPPRDLSDSQSGIKQETVAAPLPVTITEADQASVSWKCRNCDSPFNSEDAVRQHVLLSHLLDQFADLAPPDQKIYSCTHCFKYSTVSRVNFIKHLGMQHQVIREETLGRYIEHSRSLLLDIDVIKCRCGKQFDKHRQLKDHIVSNHYKDKFRQIPKGKERYECRKHHEPSCFFVADNRGLLIKHLVNEHKFLSDLDIDKFKLSNGSDSQSAVANNSDCSNENADNENNDGSPNMDQDDSHSSIDFNDSVSQAATSKNKKNIACKKAFPETHEPVVVEIEEVEIEEIPFENNTGHKCPICSKHIAQRSNFEDHLQTHKILNDVVFHCVECSFATSFAQMYYHLISFHKESSQIKLQCLCCKINMSSSGVKESIKQIRDHSTHPASQTKHQVSAKKFLELPKRTLYSMFRFSCQICSMYFKKPASLLEHGKKFNSRCYNSSVRSDPIYTCHLCDFSKAASLFGGHCQGTQHQYNLRGAVPAGPPLAAAPARPRPPLPAGITVTVQRPGRAPATPNWTDDSVVEVAPSVLELDRIPDTPDNRPCASPGQREELAARRGGSGSARLQPGPATSLYSCLQPCSLNISDSGQFQRHCQRHSNTATFARVVCNVCDWRIEGVKVAAEVTKHLFNLNHTVNVAKKVSNSIS